MSGETDRTPIQRYRPWPLTTLAITLLAGGLFYLYDLIQLIAAGPLSPGVAIGFVTGSTVCLGLGWGVWRLQAWTRIAVVWICLLIIGACIFAAPFLLWMPAARADRDISIVFPLLVVAVASVFVLRYLGRASVREAFKPLDPT